MAAETLNVMSYNVMAPIATPYRMNGQTQRMTRIPDIVATQLDVIQYTDVLLVQESMVSDYHALLADGLRKIGFVYATHQLMGRVHRLKLIQGGVVLFSRCTLVREAHCVFDRLCDGEDCLASKGCIYAAIEKNGNMYHVFGVHLQAWESHGAQHARMLQMERVKHFIQEQKIAASEPVILLGDFNVDLYSQQSQLQKMLNEVDAVRLPLHPDSHHFSSDPEINQLMGVDAATPYSSYLYPHGCYSTYLDLLSCVCCPQELLDYVCTVKGFLEPDMHSSWMRVVVTKVAPFESHLTLTMQRTIQDVSDHYPVLARLSYPQLSCKTNQYLAQPFLLEQRAHDVKQRNISWIIVAIFTFLVCTIMLWVYW